MAKLFLNIFIGRPVLGAKSSLLTGQKEDFSNHGIPDSITIALRNPIYKIH